MNLSAKLAIALMVVVVVVALLAEQSEAHRRWRRYRRHSYSHNYRYRHSYSHSRVPAYSQSHAPAPAPPPPAPVIPPDVTAFFDLLATLQQLLASNLLGNTLPPVVPVPLPSNGRLRTRREAGEDTCQGSVLPNDITQMLADMKEGRMDLNGAHSNLRSILEDLDTCELQMAFRGLDEIPNPEVTETRKKIEVFLMAPDTEESQKREVYMNTIMAVAREMTVDEVVYPYRRQAYGYSQNYLQQPTALQRYILQLVQQYPQLRQQYAPLLASLFPGGMGLPTTTTTTTPPPPPPFNANQVLGSVIGPLLTSLGVRQSMDSVINSINAIYPYVSSVAQNYNSLIDNTVFRDPRATCYLLYQYATSSSLPYGVTNTAATAYNRLNCRVDSSQSLSQVPAPVANPPAVPTTTTTTTPRPVPTCGDSSDLQRLTGVATDQFFIRARIVGGTDAGSCSTLPWQVRLNINGNQMCGGSIIDETHVLTAGHCVPDNVNYIDVTAGDYKMDSTEGSEQTVRASSVSVHPRYGTNSFGAEVNDIAVLTLSSPLDLSGPCIGKVCLSRSFNAEGHNCTVSGWGTLSSGGSIATTLQMATVETHTGSNCNSAFDIPSSAYLSYPDTQLCAGFSAGGVDSCQGDSGGPLVCLDPATNTYVQAGIVSYGNGCALANYPGIYTSTSAYYDWIQEQIQPLRG